MIPDIYAEIAQGTITDADASKEAPFDEVQIYGGGQIMFGYSNCSTCNIDIRILNIYGDKDGRVHVGFNQTFYAINGRLPVDLAVYRGGESTMHGELKVVGVTVSIEGRQNN